MAKVSFAQLKLSVDNSIKEVTFNEKNIEVKQYLPMEDKLNIVSTILNYSAEDQKFYNEGKLEVFLTLEMIYAYTNISFTDKQKETPVKLYDIITSSGLKKAIFDVIPEEEINMIESMVRKTLEGVYTYINSIYGMLDNVVADYANMDLNAGDIQKKLADPENLSLVKEILTKLG